MELSRIATKEIVRELLHRPDLRKPDGLLEPELFKLREALGAIPCVDAIPVRRRNGVVEGAVIRRGTGEYKRRLALVGGVIAYGESVEAALRRHFHDDLGLAISFPEGQTWHRPVRVVQYAPYDTSGNVLDGFRHDPTRHAVALTYLVTLESEEVRLGTTIYGQEAEEMLWFSRESCPVPEDFGYLLRDVFLDCLAEAERLV